MEKKRRFKENNGGYSLVELIIVLAIIVLLSALAFVTITMIHSAKAKEAAITFEAELKECQARARSQMVVNKNGTEYKDNTYALQIKVVGSKFYVRSIRWDPTAHYMNNDEMETRGGGKGVDLSSYIYIVYENTNGSVKRLEKSSDTPLHISFDKKGRCTGGAGTYTFYRASSDSAIATVTVNKNGSIQIK